MAKKMINRTIVEVQKIEPLEGRMYYTTPADNYPTILSSIRITNTSNIPLRFSIHILKENETEIKKENSISYNIIIADHAIYTDMSAITIDPKSKLYITSEGNENNFLTVQISGIEIINEEEPQ